MDFIRTEDLPKDCKTSDDMKGRAKFYARILYFGVPYYVPITRYMAKLLGIVTTRPPRDGELPFERKCALEEMLRDIVAAIYLQVRDTVGAEIQDTLSRQITEGMERMFSSGLGQRIGDELDRKMLPPPGGDG